MHPVLFEGSLFGRTLTLHSYGFLLGWAIFLGAELCLQLAQREGIPRPKTILFCVGVVFFGYVGSHIHGIVTNDVLREQGAGFFSGRGFTFYGAAISGTIAAVPVSRALGIPLLVVLDAAAPGLPLAHGIGRIGCFLSGCCFGIQSSHGVCFPKGSPAWADQLASGQIPASAACSLPVLPTQLVEVAGNLALAVILTLYARRGPARRGSVLLAYFAGYGPLRIILEIFFRGDPGRGTLLGLSTSTTIGIVTVALALLLWLVPGLAALRPARPAGPLPEAKT